MTDTLCGIVAAIEQVAPIAIKELSISISYRQGDQCVETFWREGRWLWILRDKTLNEIKGCGYCDTVEQALRTASAAASFVVSADVAKVTVEAA